MQTVNIRELVTRLVGVGAVTVGLVLSSGMGTAAPITAGPYECGVGECSETPVTVAGVGLIECGTGECSTVSATRDLGRAQPTTVQSVDCPRRPHILE